MANEQIGEVVCPHCKRIAPVSKNSRGKLYYNCNSQPKHCGVANLHGEGFQEWMLENATIYGAEQRTTPAEPEPEAQAENDDDSIFSWFK